MVVTLKYTSLNSFLKRKYKSTDKVINGRHVSVDSNKDWEKLINQFMTNAGNN